MHTEDHSISESVLMIAQLPKKNRNISEKSDKRKFSKKGCLLCGCLCCGCLGCGRGCLCQGCG